MTQASSWTTKTIDEIGTDLYQTFIAVFIKWKIQTYKGTTNNKFLRTIMFIIYD